MDESMSASSSPFSLSKMRVVSVDHIRLEACQVGELEVAHHRLLAASVRVQVQVQVQESEFELVLVREI